MTIRDIAHRAAVFTSECTRKLAFFAFVLALPITVYAPPAAAAEETRVAFVADQGVGDGAKRVLELIRDEGTDLLVLQGDLGYGSDAAKDWIANMDSILGANFPVLIVVGNHEDYEWPAYKQWQIDKLARVPEIQCLGDPGVKSYCTYRNFGIVQVSPGIANVPGINGKDNYPEFITDVLSTDDSDWRICSWHKNMRDMQAGAKSDETGWGVYQSCLAQGGIVLTGHEHSYSRTHLMSSFEAKQVIHTDNQMEIGPNSSIAIVSGLGGFSVRPQRHGGDWFASIYTADQQATHGALFCTFARGDADCIMKDIAGKVPDAFTLKSQRYYSASAEQARLEAEAAAAEQARLEAEAAAAEQARLEAEAAAAEQARLEAEAAAAEQARLEAEAAAAEQARLEAEAAAAEQARLEAEAAAAEQARLEAEAAAAEQARLEAEAAAAEQAQLESEQSPPDAGSAAGAPTPGGAQPPATPDSNGIQDDATSGDTGSSTDDPLEQVPTSNVDANTPLVSGPDLSPAPPADSPSSSAGNTGGGGSGYYLLLIMAGYLASRRQLSIHRTPDSGLQTPDSRLQTPDTRRMALTSDRHPHESGDPGHDEPWIPACAGMTFSPAWE